MSFFSRLSSKRQHGDKHQGSNYYKREGFLSRILKEIKPKVIKKSGNKKIIDQYVSPLFYFMCIS